jgi:hypothetical protein
MYKVYIYICVCVYGEAILHLGVDYIGAAPGHVVRARAPPGHYFLVCGSRGSDMQEIKALSVVGN